MKRLSPRYAKVLFNLSGENLEKRALEFDAILGLLESQLQVKRLLQAPQISMAEKKSLIQKLLQPFVDLKMIHFLFYLVEKKHLNLLQSIGYEFRQLVNASLNIWEADLMTAVPIEIDLENRLRVKLENIFSKKIKINKKIDPKIIGGAILIAGNEMIDWSITGRLRKLREMLLAVGD